MKVTHAAVWGLTTVTECGRYDYHDTLVMTEDVKAVTCKRCLGKLNPTPRKPRAKVAYHVVVSGAFSSISGAMTDGRRIRGLVRSHYASLRKTERELHSAEVRAEWAATTVTRQVCDGGECCKMLAEQDARHAAELAAWRAERAAKLAADAPSTTPTVTTPTGRKSTAQTYVCQNCKVNRTTGGWCMECTAKRVEAARTSAPSVPVMAGGSGLPEPSAAEVPPVAPEAAGEPLYYAQTATGRVAHITACGVTQYGFPSRTHAPALCGPMRGDGWVWVWELTHNMGQPICAKCADRLSSDDGAAHEAESQNGGATMAATYTREIVRTKGINETPTRHRCNEKWTRTACGKVISRGGKYWYMGLVARADCPACFPQAEVAAEVVSAEVPPVAAEVPPAPSSAVTPAMRAQYQEIVAGIEAEARSAPAPGSVRAVMMFCRWCDKLIFRNDPGHECTPAPMAGGSDEAEAAPAGTFSPSLAALTYQAALAEAKTALGLMSARDELCGVYLPEARMLEKAARMLRALDAAVSAAGGVKPIIGKVTTEAEIAGGSGVMVEAQWTELPVLTLARNVRLGAVAFYESTTGETWERVTVEHGVYVCERCRVGAHEVYRLLVGFSERYRCEHCVKVMPTMAGGSGLPVPSIPARWVRKDRVQLTASHVMPGGCVLCGTRYGLGPNEIACKVTTCLACGTTQCMSNGTGRGQCGVCLVGLLPGWSGADRVCGYAHCNNRAVAAMPRVGVACKDCIGRNRSTVARDIAERLEWRIKYWVIMPLSAVE